MNHSWWGVATNSTTAVDGSAVRDKMNSTTVQIRRQELNPVLTAAICLLLAEYTINFEVTVIVTYNYGYENSQPEQYNR